MCIRFERVVTGGMLLACAVPALAQMTQVSESRSVAAYAYAEDDFGFDEDSQFDGASMMGMPFNPGVFAGAAVGSVDADAYADHYSEFRSDSITFTGFVQASACSPLRGKFTSVDGAADARSTCSFTFTVDANATYCLYAFAGSKSGDTGGLSIEVTLQTSDGMTVLDSVDDSGEYSVEDVAIAAGEYTLFAEVFTAVEIFKIGDFESTDGLIDVFFEVKLASSCPGDFDGSGLYDFPDLDAILANWGTSVTPGTAGDFNGDGVVDFTDLDMLLGLWNTSCS